MRIRAFERRRWISQWQLHRETVTRFEARESKRKGCEWEKSLGHERKGRWREMRRIGRGASSFLHDFHREEKGMPVTSEVDGLLMTRDLTPSLRLFLRLVSVPFLLRPEFKCPVLILITKNRRIDPAADGAVIRPSSLGCNRCHPGPSSQRHVDGNLHQGGTVALGFRARGPREQSPPFSAAPRVPASDNDKRQVGGHIVWLARVINRPLLA